MPSLAEQRRLAEEAQDEQRRALAERDRWMGNPWRRRQREEEERRERHAQAREASRTAEEERILESNRRQAEIAASSTAAREARQQWRAFVSSWSDALNLARRQRDEAVTAQDLEAAAAAQLRIVGLSRLEPAVEKESAKYFPDNSPAGLAERGIVMAPGRGGAPAVDIV